MGEEPVGLTTFKQQNGTKYGRAFKIISEKTNQTTITCRDDQKAEKISM